MHRTVCLLAILFCLLSAGCGGEDGPKDPKQAIRDYIRETLLEGGDFEEVVWEGKWKSTQEFTTQSLGAGGEAEGSAKTLAAGDALAFGLEFKPIGTGPPAQQVLSIYGEGGGTANMVFVVDKDGTSVTGVSRMIWTTMQKEGWAPAQ